MNGPGVSQWLKQMSSNLPLERMTYIQKSRQQELVCPFVSYIYTKRDIELLLKYEYNGKMYHFEKKNIIQ